MNHDRCKQFQRVKTSQRLSTLSMQEDLTFLWIVETEFKLLEIGSIGSVQKKWSAALCPPPPYSHSLTVTVYRMNHDRCEQLGRVRTFQGLSTLSMKEDLTFLWIVRRIKKIKFLQPILVQTGSISLERDTWTGYSYPLFLHLQKILVLSKYLRNEMRSAKMKSFRLNGILRRMFEQSFEEIGEPFVVGRRSVGQSSVGNTVSNL